MEIKTILTLDDIGSCFETFQELRPHLIDKQEFIKQIFTQFNEGYQIKAIIDENQVAACIGYRVFNTLANGKILYIDDLITAARFRCNSYGAQLLNIAISYARELNCAEVHLDSGYTRFSAHKLYLKHGFQLNCHHLSLKLTN